MGDAESESPALSQLVFVASCTEGGGKCMLSKTEHVKRFQVHVQEDRADDIQEQIEERPNQADERAVRQTAPGEERAERVKHAHCRQCPHAAMRSG